MATAKFISKSGYVIPDVFEELTTKILQTTGSADDKECICHWSAELVCSGKMKALTTLVIELYASRFIGRDLTILERLATLLISCQKERFNWKSGNARLAICQSILMLAGMTSSSAIKSLSTVVTHAHQQYINALHCSPRGAATDIVLGVLGSLFVDVDILHLLVALWEHLQDRNLSGACIIIDYITQKGKTQPACATLHVVQDVPKSLRCDVVWSLWQIVIEYAARTNDSLYERYAKANLDLFRIEYSRQSRKMRLNLLYATIVVILKSKRVGVSESKAMAGMAEVSHIFDTILGKTVVRKPRGSMKPVAHPSASLANTTPDKLKMLFCYTYSDPQSLPKREEAKAEWKELDVKCGTWNPSGSDGVTVQKLSSATHQR